MKDVDLNRAQLIVRGGKGDKDRVPVLAVSLTERLRAHRDRLRTLPHVMNRPGLGLRSPLDGRGAERQEAVNPAASCPDL